MPECELLKDCLISNNGMSPESGFGAVYMRRYCQGDSMKCARYMVASVLGQEEVPEELFPNMGPLARSMIAGK